MPQYEEDGRGNFRPLFENDSRQRTPDPEAENSLSELLETLSLPDYTVREEIDAENGVRTVMIVDADGDIILTHSKQLENEYPEEDH